MSLLKTAATMGSDYYPETLGVYLILNAPSFFPFCWRIVKHFVDEKTRESIKVIPPEQQMTELLKIINAEDIPSFLGGECKCASTK
jgi:hypothetical protein